MRALLVVGDTVLALALGALLMHQLGQGRAGFPVVLAIAALLVCAIVGKVFLLRRLTHSTLLDLSGTLAELSSQRRRHLFLPESPQKIARAIEFHFAQLMLENEQLFTEAREREAIYTSILDTQKELVFILDRDGYISYRNRAFEDMFGAPSLDLDEEASTLSENLASLMQQIRPILHSDEAWQQGITFTSRLEIRDRTRHIIWAVNGVTNVDPDKLLFVGRDETEEMEIRGRNAQLEKIATVGRAASTIFHEINQPLTIMRLSSFMIKSTLEAEAHRLSPTAKGELLDNAAILENQIDRSSQIINNLRLFHSGDRRRLETELIPVAELVADAVSMVAVDINGSGIILENPPPRGEAGTVFGNRILFTQVLVNILKNSIQALRGDGPVGGGTILLSLVADSREVRIGVEDNGPGMPEGDLARATEPFFTTKNEGSGLGLALCLDILNSYGGRLDIRNRQPAGLATTVTLPLADHVDQSNGNPSPPSGQSPGL